MSYRTICVFLFISLGFCDAISLARAAERIEPRLPNIILINCDDLGYGDLGCYGAKDLRTPNLDRMAKEGTRFTDFSVVTALCTPSRVALMTGKYPGRMGLATGVLRPDATTGVPGAEVTLAELVKPLGYAKGYIGKWHLGFVPGLRPMDQGFDSYYGVMHNLDKPETVHFEKVGGMPILRGDKVVDRPADPAKMTGLYTKECLDFITAHREQPFFLYLGHAMPHLPFDASATFKGKSKRGLYGDVVEELDASTGKILDQLRELKLAENTIVIFTSDNGPERKTPGSAAPLKGSKHTVFEGGVRVPFIVWGPGRVPADRVCGEFITALDVLPTLAKITGSPAIDRVKIDGLDVSPVLLGARGARSPRQELFVHYGLNKSRQEAIRVGQWKLHLKTPVTLYDLSSDIGESTDVAAKHPDVVDRLKARAAEIQREIESSRKMAQ